MCRRVRNNTATTSLSETQPDWHPKHPPFNHALCLTTAVHSTTSQQLSHFALHNNNTTCFRHSQEFRAEQRNTDSDNQISSDDDLHSRSDLIIVAGFNTTERAQKG